MNQKTIKPFLDFYSDKYNQRAFIEHDPISIPHRFSKKQDIEIIGFWVAMLSWGNRKTIINKGLELCERMDHAPYDFVLNHQEEDRRKFETFVQRTFNYTDSLYFLSFFQSWYKTHDSLEAAFVGSEDYPFMNLEAGLESLNQHFFSGDEVPQRTRKHVSKPSSGSRCKRILMFLRWMVRKDDRGVDFGIWKKLQPSQLMLPLDVHVERTARLLGLLKRNILDWKAVIEISEACRAMRPEDPAFYDYGLFGISLAMKQEEPDILKFLRNNS